MTLNYDWETVEKGTPVKVVGERGNFTFCKQDKNGDIEVYGGANGHLMFRTFTANRIRIKGKRRTEKATNV
jgi:hypothetical protein